MSGSKAVYLTPNEATNARKPAEAGFLATHRNIAATHAICVVLLIAPCMSKDHIAGSWQI